MDEALPDLAHAVRAVIAKSSGSNRRLRPACTISPPLSENPAPQAAPAGNVNIPSIIPNLELMR